MADRIPLSFYIAILPYGDIMRGAIYVSDSGNTKIMGSQKVDATYASIKKTCPDTCSLKNTGCYAQMSYTGIVTRRNDKRAKGESPLDVARSEAKAIDMAYGGGAIPFGRALRLHVAGDSRTVKGTRVLNKAIGRWKTRGGGSCWSYTHAWRHVPRKEWSNVSILASVEDPKDIAAARAQGYAPAIVVGTFPTDKAFTVPGSDTTFIPCVNQTRGVGCSDCQLCFKADWLYETNRGIAFQAHGVYKDQMKRRLNVIQN